MPPHITVQDGVITSSPSQDSQESQNSQNSQDSQNSQNSQDDQNNQDSQDSHDSHDSHDSQVRQDSYDSQYKAASPNQGPDISFAGCGGMVIYHVGVSCCLSLWSPHLLQNRVVGTSCGAGLAAALVAGISFEKMASMIMDFSQLFPWMLSPTCDVSRILRRNIDKLMPDDAHIRAKDRVHISITQIWGRANNTVHDFASKEDLLDAIIASSLIPFLVGWTPLRIGGALSIDGFFSDYAPALDSATITVSPFAGNTSICPLDRDEYLHEYEQKDESDAILGIKIPLGPSTSINVSADNFLRCWNIIVPPSAKQTDSLCCQGYRDALRFLLAEGHIQCSQCREKSRVKAEVEDRKTTSSQEEKKTTSIREDKRTTCDQCQMKRQEAQASSLPQSVRDEFKENLCQEEGWTGCDIQ